MMIILGLTGSIGMGKSTAASMLRRMGIPVHDADATVHRLIGPGGAAVRPIDEAFPGVVQNGRVNRVALGAQVFLDPIALRQLEEILHPLVRQAEHAFLIQAARRRSPMVALDVPLLLETGGDRRVDAVFVISAPAAIQAVRVLRRPGMTRDRLHRILAQQMSDREKRQKADFVIETGLGRGFSLKQLALAVAAVKEQPGTHWGPKREWLGVGLRSDARNRS